MVPKGGHEAGELARGHGACPTCLSPRRYGKRDREETLDILEWGSPRAAAPRWVCFPALCASIPGAEMGVWGGESKGPGLA